MSVVMNLLDTDPLAKFALVGLAITLVVSLGLFGFVMTRRDQRRR